MERQPHKQPDQAAKSAWIERSVPGGEGHNGITFDNTAGAETIEVHAQRDRVVHVLHSERETIGANQTSTVGANRTATVGGNDTTIVGADRTKQVGGNEVVEIAKSRAVTIKGDSDELHVTDGDKTETIDKGNYTRQTKLEDAVEADTVRVHARKEAFVTGDQKVQVKQGDTTATFEGGNVELDAAGHVVLRHKSTTVEIADGGKVTVTADPELEMNCGGAQVQMGQGKVAVQAPQELTLAVGQTGIKLSADGWEVTGPKGKFSGLTGPIEGAAMLIKLN